MQSVKNIIFDFGGVIINLDPEAVPLAFRKIAGEQFEAVYADLLKLDIFTRLERGDMSEEDFLQTITKTGLFTEAQAIDCWNAILLTVPKNRLDLLERLAKDYNLYLLSNTNGIHAAKFEADMKEMYGIEDFRKDFFVKGYYSHEINLLKPDAAIYKYVAEDSNLVAGETLFVDDNKDNIESAKTVGWQTILHQRNEEIEPILLRYLGIE